MIRVSSMQLLRLWFVYTDNNILRPNNDINNLLSYSIKFYALLPMYIFSMVSKKLCHSLVSSVSPNIFFPWIDPHAKNKNKNKKNTRNLVERPYLSNRMFWLGECSLYFWISHGTSVRWLCTWSLINVCWWPGILWFHGSWWFWASQGFQKELSFIKCLSSAT